MKWPRISDYHKNSATTLGIQVRCKRCVARRLSSYREALGHIKVERGCADCGFNRWSEALDFDHVRGEKSFSIGVRLSSLSWGRLLAEIEKCEVVCANCHRHRTEKRRA